MVSCFGAAIAARERTWLLRNSKSAKTMQSLEKQRFVRCEC